MIDGLKPYPAMKDSAVPGLGEVPVAWDVIKLRHILRRVTERNRADLPLLSVVRERGVVRRDMTSEDENHNFIPDDLSNYKVVRAGQFAMNKMKAWQGSYGVSQHEGVVSPAYFVFDLTGVAGRFFHAAIRSRAYVPSFTQASDGVRIGQWDLAEPRMREIQFAIPPLLEQSAIVRFLDHADGLIRRAIRAKQKLIKLLEEQKEAIGHRAVTRGLDPNVRLKSSGVAWLGDVPEHWAVKKLRQCVDIVGGMTPSMETRRYWDGSIPWVTPKDMKRMSLGDSSVRVTEAAIDETSLRRLPVPAVLMVVRGMILARRVPIAWTTAAVTINQDMKALLPRSGVNAEFLATLLSAAQGAFVPLIDEAGHGTRRLPTERWRDLCVVLPPEDEQVEIIRHLAAVSSRAERFALAATSEVSLLREYRTRLIADVVTGKLDVRDAAAHLPDEVKEAEPIDEIETEDHNDEPGTDDSAEVPEETEA